MATITKDASNLAELKAALQSASAGDTLNINITKDITVGQPALPAPSAWVETKAQTVHIHGNSHTVSGINLPSQVYSKSLIYMSNYSGDRDKLYIHDLKILNALCVDTPLVSGDKTIDLYLYNSTLTGNFNLFFKANNSSTTNQGIVDQCNIAITTGHDFRFPPHAINSHIYASFLAKTDGSGFFYGYTNSYIEINDKFAVLNYDRLDWLFRQSENSCINLVSNVSGTIDTSYAKKGVCVFNATHAPNLKSTVAKVKGITDDQMKNADYLNSIGFAVNETN